jgi:glyoxylate reductase
LVASLPKVVVTRRLPGVSPARLGTGAVLAAPPPDSPMPREELLRLVPGTAGILCTLADRIDAAVMDAAGPGLKVVSNYAVGVNNIDVAEAGRRGVRVCNTPDVLTQATADLGFALLLAAARKSSPGGIPGDFSAFRSTAPRSESSGWGRSAAPSRCAPRGSA